MASVRARLGASIACALAATLLPAVAATAPASAAPAPLARAAAVGVPVAASVQVPASDRTVPVSRSARVVLSKAALRNPVLRGRAVIGAASRLRGIPYVAGGTTPRSGFDCSGYTKYVFSRLGISIPRVSRDQYRWAVKIKRSQAVPGDLVFFHHGGRVYHAAIYAGGNRVWHSPYPGKRVMLERIWASSIYFARVRVR
jgi:cell wall-associated NlpC family hydrolase